MRKQSAPITIAQRVDALVGPSLGRHSRILMMLLEPLSSRMSISLLVMPSMMLTQADNSMFLRLLMLRGKHCTRACIPCSSATGKILRSTSSPAHVSFQSLGAIQRKSEAVQDPASVAELSEELHVKSPVTEGETVS